jgi:hypothetical protein
MKRNTERVVFFLLGGLFVISGYLLGAFNYGVEAEDKVKNFNRTIFDRILCKELIVSDGHPEHGVIALKFVEGKPFIYISEHYDVKNKSGSGALVSLSISGIGEGAVLQLIGEQDGSNGYISLMSSGGAPKMLMMTDVQQDDGIAIGTGESGSTIILEGDLIHFAPKPLK